MKNILRRILWVITLPWRVVRGAYRAVAGFFGRIKLFFTEVPEDVSITDTVADALGNRDSLRETLGGLGEHVDALRRALFRALIALAITTGISFLFAEQLMGLLAVPLGSLDKLQVIEPTEAVGVFMRVSLLSGVAFAMPWIILEIFLFVAPGLMPRSRVTMLLSIPAASILFILGMAFTYYVMLPTAIPVLEDFLGFKAAWRPSSYFGLVTSLMFWVGLAFQMPLIVYALAAVGVLHAKQLAQQWRLAIVVIAIIAAAVTPTVDPVNMALVMAPMILLYGFSIVGAAIAERARRRDLDRRAVAAGGTD
jgi:sec-independent protein translocase protein TatC